jgi:SAM-dependent methyltransferase
MRFASLVKRVDDYYSAKLHEHGPCARGVDWNSSESQSLRFDQLLGVCDFSEDRSINDFGCGYGALLDHLHARGLEAEYRGFDVSAAMVAEARRRHGTDDRRRFGDDPAGLTVADYTLASGIFNVRLETPEAEWEDYIRATLETLDRLSRRGFAFNMLTGYSDPGRMRGDLYYGDPCVYFDHCKRRFSKQVALLHDYGLYEFTIRVRKPPATDPTTVVPGRA